MGLLQLKYERGSTTTTEQTRYLFSAMRVALSPKQALSLSTVVWVTSLQAPWTVTGSTGIGDAVVAHSLTVLRTSRMPSRVRSEVRFALVASSLKILI